VINFDRHSDCQLCLLHESANNPGLPTRSMIDNKLITNKRAILFVGQSPGYKEDQSTRQNPQGKSFIGYTGGLLENLINTAKLTDYCDIYFANACRCKPPQGADESQSQIRACRPYLKEDIAKLQLWYEEVIIVVLGAKACYSVAHISSLNDGFKKQGMRASLFPAEDGVCPRIFFTYHPAMLHPTRKPALIRAVKTHFELLLRYIKGEFIPNELVVEPLVGIDVPVSLPSHVSIDIETYGILAGKEQTVFNPHKSKYIDGIDYEDQIVTVSFGWRDLDGKLHTALYIWKDPRHRRLIRKWFYSICNKKSVLIGQNIKFDLMYLWMSGDKEIQYWIQPEHLVTDDVMVLSFLLFEQQPEKGLKELAALYGVADYSGLRVTGSSGNAKSCYDKDLHYYNCLDSAVTLVLYEELNERIKQRYGEKSFKSSYVCKQMRNTVTWDTFDLALNGSSVDVKRLKSFHESEQSICERILENCEINHGLKLAGKGSDAPLREFMLKCMQEAGLLDDGRVEWTKTKKISIGVENVNLVKEHLPEGENLNIITEFQEFKEKSKIVNTYTRPLLEEPRRGIVHSEQGIGMVYPSWYPIPAYFERGGKSDEKSGGQIQGRFSCQKPARQTEPQSIRKCSVSRWPDGKLVEYDISQDHLRMAALLSGDPILMETYHTEGKSIHLETASTIFPDIFCSDFKEKYHKEYVLSKNLNFLVLFRGGPAAYQREAREKVGIELPYSFCAEAINKWYLKHHVYKEWQDQMIALASRQGYLILPTGWSRTFGPPGTNLSAFEGEVLNFMHQTPCAQNLQSSHFQILCKFRKYHLHSLTCLQIYDALFADIYPGEEKIVDEIVGEAMEHPPLLPILERWVGRTIPWVYEKKEYTK